MTRYRFRPLALADLEAVLEYVAADSPQAALRMHNSILETCTLLGENPYIAAELEGLSVAGVRRFQVKHYPRYSIFYQIVEAHIEVVRVGFGGRDWEELIR